MADELWKPLTCCKPLTNRRLCISNTVILKIFILQPAAKMNNPSSTTSNLLQSFLNKLLQVWIIYMWQRQLWKLCCREWKANKNATLTTSPTIFPAGALPAAKHVSRQALDYCSSWQFHQCLALAFASILRTKVYLFFSDELTLFSDCVYIVLDVFRHLASMCLGLLSTLWLTASSLACNKQLPLQSLLGLPFLIRSAKLGNGLFSCKRAPFRYSPADYTTRRIPFTTHADLQHWFLPLIVNSSMLRKVFPCRRPLFQGYNIGFPSWQQTPSYH